MTHTGPNADDDERPDPALEDDEDVDFDPEADEPSALDEFSDEIRRAIFGDDDDEDATVSGSGGGGGGGGIGGPGASISLPEIEPGRKSRPETAAPPVIQNTPAQGENAPDNWWADATTGPEVRRDDDLERDIEAVAGTTARTDEPDPNRNPDVPDDMREDAAESRQASDGGDERLSLSDPLEERADIDADALDALVAYEEADRAESEADPYAYFATLEGDEDPYAHLGSALAGEREEDAGDPYEHYTGWMQEDPASEAPAPEAAPEPGARDGAEDGRAAAPARDDALFADREVAQALVERAADIYARAGDLDRGAQSKAIEQAQQQAQQYASLALDHIEQAASTRAPEIVGKIPPPGATPDERIALATDRIEQATQAAKSRFEQAPTADNARLLNGIIQERGDVRAGADAERPDQAALAAESAANRAERAVRAAATHDLRSARALLDAADVAVRSGESGRRPHGGPYKSLTRAAEAIGSSLPEKWRGQSRENAAGAARANLTASEAAERAGSALQRAERAQATRAQRTQQRIEALEGQCSRIRRRLDGIARRPSPQNADVGERLQRDLGKASRQIEALRKSDAEIQQRVERIRELKGIATEAAQAASDWAARAAVPKIMGTQGDTRQAEQAALLATRAALLAERHAGAATERQRERVAQADRLGTRSERAPTRQQIIAERIESLDARIDATLNLAQEINGRHPSERNAERLGTVEAAADRVRALCADASVWRETANDRTGILGEARALYEAEKCLKLADSQLREAIQAMPDPRRADGTVAVQDSLASPNAASTDARDALRDAPAEIRDKALGHLERAEDAARWARQAADQAWSIAQDSPTRRNERAAQKAAMFARSAERFSGCVADAVRREAETGGGRDAATLAAAAEQAARLTLRSMPDPRSNGRAAGLRQERPLSLAAQGTRAAAAVGIAALSLTPLAIGAAVAHVVPTLAIAATAIAVVAAPKGTMGVVKWVGKHALKAQPRAFKQIQDAAGIRNRNEQAVIRAARSTDAALQRAERAMSAFERAAPERKLDTDFRRAQSNLERLRDGAELVHLKMQRANLPQRRADLREALTAGREALRAEQAANRVERHIDLARARTEARTQGNTEPASLVIARAMRDDRRDLRDGRTVATVKRVVGRAALGSAVAGVAAASYVSGLTTVVGAVAVVATMIAPRKTFRLVKSSYKTGKAIMRGELSGGVKKRMRQANALTAVHAAIKTEALAGRAERAARQLAQEYQASPTALNRHAAVEARAAASIARQAADKAERLAGRAERRGFGTGARDVITAQKQALVAERAANFTARMRSAPSMDLQAKSAKLTPGNGMVARNVLIGAGATLAVGTAALASQTLIAPIAGVVVGAVAAYKVVRHPIRTVQAIGRLANGMRRNAEARQANSRAAVQAARSAENTAATLERKADQMRQRALIDERLSVSADKIYAAATTARREADKAARCAEHAGQRMLGGSMKDAEKAERSALKVERLATHAERLAKDPQATFSEPRMQAKPTLSAVAHAGGKFAVAAIKLAVAVVKDVARPIGYVAGTITLGPKRMQSLARRGRIERKIKRDNARAKRKLDAKIRVANRSGAYRSAIEAEKLARKAEVAVAKAREAGAGQGPQMERAVDLAKQVREAADTAAAWAARSEVPRLQASLNDAKAAQSAFTSAAQKTEKSEQTIKVVEREIAGRRPDRADSDGSGRHERRHDSVVRTALREQDGGRGETRGETVRATLEGQTNQAEGRGFARAH